MRLLRLTLKRRWFDMIASDQKKHEYRIPGPWINARLKPGKEYDAVEFKNGYGQDVPTCIVEYLGHTLGTGREDWGAKPGTQYEIILLGSVLEVRNATAQTPPDSGTKNHG